MMTQEQGGRYVEAWEAAGYLLDGAHPSWRELPQTRRCAANWLAQADLSVAMVEKLRGFLENPPEGT